MNKIHSCTQVKPAVACSFLSLPRASWFLGCLWDWVAWPGWRLTPEPLAGSWCRGSCWLTHLHLLPESSPAAHASVLSLPRGVPLAHPGELVPKEPLGTLPVAPMHLPQQHTHVVGHPSPTLAHTCHRAAGPRHRGTQARCVQHTGTVTTGRSGDGWGKKQIGCPSCPVSLPAPCWHIPAWTPTTWRGDKDKDTVPLHTPRARSWCRMGCGGWSSGHPQSCPP